jgi:hypothetical protein
MVFSAVLAVSFFNGLNTNVWTGWVFFAVFLGIVLLLLFTVRLLVLSLRLKRSFFPLSLFTIPSAQAGSSPMSTATTISCSDPPTSGFVNHSALPSHFCRGICTVHGSWAMPRVTWSSCVTSEKRSPILTWPPLCAVIVVKGLHGLHHHQGGDRRRGRRGRRPSRRCLLVPQMPHQL